MKGGHVDSDTLSVDNCYSTELVILVQCSKSFLLVTFSCGFLNYSEIV